MFAVCIFNFLCLDAQCPPFGFPVFAVHKYEYIDVFLKSSPMTAALADWFPGWLACFLAGWLALWLACWLACLLTLIAGVSSFYVCSRMFMRVLARRFLDFSGYVFRMIVISEADAVFWWPKL